MNNKFKNFIIFALGAATGSAVTWKLLKTKYEQLAQEEIDSVKEVFSRKDIPSKDEVESKIETPNEKAENKPAVASYMEYTDKLGYTNYSNLSGEDEENANEDEPVSSVAPYVVSPDEFGFAEGYDIVNLTYYADKILADDTDDVIEDVEGTIGEASLRHFGEYEPDAVHVRNDVRRVEYEILRVRETYSEATGRTYPDQQEDE